MWHRISLWVKNWLENQVCFLTLRKMAARAKELMNSLGMDINVTKKANTYAVAQLQMVEIAKAIDSNAWVVVMDEPTAAITEADKDKLFELIRKLKEQGIAIVYISHRMSEIFDIADEVSVLMRWSADSQLTILMK